MGRWTYWLIDRWGKSTWAAIQLATHHDIVEVDFHEVASASTTEISRLRVKTSNLKETIKERSAEYAQLQVENKAGPLQKRFTTFLEKQIHAIASVYHGGKLAGSGVNRFLGHSDKARVNQEKADAKKDYRDALEDLEQGMAEEVGAGRLEDNIRVSICDVLNRIIRPLCDKLSRVSWIINSHADLSSQLQAMIFECKQCVAFYRENLVLKTEPLIGKKRIRVKQHHLETHIPEFLLLWRSTGIFSESVIEAYHAICNSRRRQ